jgi:hypothetical protein
MGDVNSFSFEGHIYKLLPPSSGLCPHDLWKQKAIFSLSEVAQGALLRYLSTPTLSRR